MSLTTAEEAARICSVRSGSTTRWVEWIVTLAELRNGSPELAHYLSHPEIIIGIAEGALTPVTLKERLQQMWEADNNIEE